MFADASAIYACNSPVTTPWITETRFNHVNQTAREAR